MPAASPFEVVDDPPPAAPKPGPKSDVVLDDDEPRGRRRPRREREDEDDDEPRRRKRRRDRDDDDDDADDADDRRRDPAPLPGSVRAAAIIWMVYGSLQLFGTILGFILQAGNQAANAAAGNNNAAGSAGSPCCGIAIGIAFAYCGHQTLKGEAKDTLGNSVGSLLIGLLQALLAVGLIFIAAGVLGNNANLALDEEVLYVVAVLVGLMGSMLLLAGTLGLMGRSGYREWREVNRPKKRRRRRRREDDGEDEDD